MRKTQALIFDVDGTAIDSPAQSFSSERLKQTVLALKDRYFICAATGRPWLSGIG